MLRLIMNIVANTRMLAKQVPAATPEVQQINDLVQKIHSKIIGSQPGPEPQAPPV
jgi:hypothetical protein